MFTALLILAGVLVWPELTLGLLLLLGDHAVLGVIALLWALARAGSPQVRVMERIVSRSMTREEACDALAIPYDAGADVVQDAYRRMMRRVHPDVGGSHFLAAKVNEAKQILMGA
jgi:hypothetical protein